MDDLISRKAAIDAVEYITSSMSVCVNSDECHGMKRMQRQAVIELTNLPSAQPERKKGTWSPWKYHNGFRCENCNEPVDNKYNFCPSCGADMRKERKG